MSRPSWTLLSAALLSLSSFARAGGSVKADAGPVVTAPVVTNTQTNTITAPGMNAGVGTPSGMGVNVGVNAGANVSGNAAAANAQAAGVVPSAGAAAVDAAARAVTTSNNSAQAAATQSPAAADPGAALMTPGASARHDGRGAGAPSAINGAATQIEKARALEAKGAEGSTAQALDAVFDLARQSSVKVGGPGSIAGKTGQVQDKIRQTVKIADTASPHDAPALYKDAIKTAEQAALAKTISNETARSVADTVVRSAFQRAERKLTDLANQAYAAAVRGEAAGRPGVDKAFKSFAKWDEFLGGGPQKPLVANLSDLKSDVERVMIAADKPGARKDRVAPRAKARREGDRFVLELPGIASAGAAAALPQDFLPALALKTKGLGADAPPALALSDDASTLSSARLIYSAHRRAGRSAAGAARAAAGFAVRSSARWLLETLSSLFDAVLGRLMPGRADFGSGALVSNDRRLSRLSALKRELTADEKSAAGVAFLDLSALRSAPRTLDDAKKLAARYRELTGDASAEGALAQKDIPGGLELWAARLPQALADHLDRQFLAAARKSGAAALAYGDLKTGLGRVVAPTATPALAAELQGLGFETEIAGGALRAWTSGAGVAERLAAALDRAKGAPAPATDAAALARAAAYVDAHPAEAKKDAERLQAEDPTLSGFAPAGLVTARGRSLWAETAERRAGGRALRWVLLRDVDTRRPLFGHSEPLPAR